MPWGVTSAVLAVGGDTLVSSHKNHYKKLLKNIKAIDVAVVVDSYHDGEIPLDDLDDDYASGLLESINEAATKLFTHFAGIIDFDYLPELQVTDQRNIVMIMRLRLLDNEFDQSDLVSRLSGHHKNLKRLAKAGKNDEFYLPLFINRNDKLVEIGQLLKEPIFINEQPRPRPEPEPSRPDFLPIVKTTSL